MKKLGQIEKSSLSDQAFKVIKERILEGQMPPSSHFVADDIAKELGISRTPVREALSKLALGGLVNYNGKGYSVASYTANDIRELFAVRRILEMYALRECFARLSEDHLSRFRLAYERAQKRIKEKGEDSNIMIKLDADLHQFFYDGSGNQRLIKILEDIAEQLGLIHKWGNITKRTEYIESAKIEEYGDFLSSLESKDLKRASHLLEQHLTSGEEFTLECLGFT